MFQKLKQEYERFHGDERGEIPIGPLLIIALIIVPLVLLLVFFRDELVDFFATAIDNLFKKSKKGENPKAPKF